jgi:hypothetical protein
MIHRKIILFALQWHMDDFIMKAIDKEYGTKGQRRPEK